MPKPNFGRTLLNLALQQVQSTQVNKTTHSRKTKGNSLDNVNICTETTAEDSHTSSTHSMQTFSSNIYAFS